MKNHSLNYQNFNQSLKLTEIQFLKILNLLNLY